jgi:hypothetical protein
MLRVLVAAMNAQRVGKYHLRVSYQLINVRKSGILNVGIRILSETVENNTTDASVGILEVHHFVGFPPVCYW